MSIVNKPNESETVESLTQKLGKPGIKWNYLEMDDGELIAVKSPDSLVTQAMLHDLKSRDAWVASVNYVAGCLIVPSRARFEQLINEQPGLIDGDEEAGIVGLVTMCKKLSLSRVVRRKKD